jgi:predicted lipoprotein with Yx(FWY)xxD motif
MNRSLPAPRTLIALAAALALAVALAACGDDDSSSSDNSTTAASSSAADTVSVQSVSGAGDVLVDAQGMVLYTNDQDTSSKIACTGECTAIWIPLTLPAGSSSPTGPADVESKLDVVMNPDGDQQVTLNGMPLYTFTQDSAGEATGNGVTDSFGGTSFTWSAAGANGSSGGGAGQTSTTTSSSSSGGDYGY